MVKVWKFKLLLTFLLDILNLYYHSDLGFRYSSVILDFFYWFFTFFFTMSRDWLMADFFSTSSSSIACKHWSCSEDTGVFSLLLSEQTGHLRSVFGKCDISMHLAQSTCLQTRNFARDDSRRHKEHSVYFLNKRNDINNSVTKYSKQGCH